MQTYSCVANKAAATIALQWSSVADTIASRCLSLHTNEGRATKCHGHSFTVIGIVALKTLRHFPKTTALC